MLKLLVGLFALVFVLPVVLAVVALLPLVLLVLLPLCLLGVGFGLVAAVIGAVVAIPAKLLGCLCHL